MVNWNEEIDIHNKSQEALVARVQDFLKLMLVLSGGALAVCAGFFSETKELVDKGDVISKVGYAWCFLTASMVFSVLAISSLACYDYIFHENRSVWIDTKGCEEFKSVSDWWHRFAFIFVVFSLTAFLLGIVFFCCAALEYFEFSWL